MNGIVVRGIGAMALLLVETSLAAASFRQVVNIDARQYGDFAGNPPTLNVSVPSGIFRLTPVNPELDTDAIYTAWCAFPPPAQLWDSAVAVYWLNSHAQVGVNGHFSNYIAAFNDPANHPIEIFVPIATELRFGVVDNILNDNREGASILLELVSSCPADLNGDGQVDDADFSQFASAYNILVCSEIPEPECPQDFNRDSFVDDADFAIFVASYNQLLCPVGV